MFRSRGLRLAIAGAVLFLVSVASLVVLPQAVSIVGILVGGICVWAGFIWTLLGYYITPGPPSDS